MSEHPDIDDTEAFEHAAKRWQAKGLSPAPKARKAREKQMRSTVDGRSLRATGRVDQFNFKCRPEVRTFVNEAAKEEGLTIAEWMEALIETAMAARRK